MFANDTKIFCAIRNRDDYIASALQIDLNIYTVQMITYLAAEINWI